MSKWEKVKLRDVCEINIGKTPSRDNVLFWNNGIYKWLSISDMQDKYLIDSKEKISMEAVGKCNMKLIPINTVVMSFKLSVGKVGILSEPMYSNEAIANFPILNCEKLHANFLYYALQSLKFENMDRAAKGLTLNKAKLNQLKIPFPPLEVQQKIAQTLDAAAALIALRKQQLAALDNLIKSVFYEMFGDPVTNEKKWEIKTLDQLSAKTKNSLKRGPFGGSLKKEIFVNDGYLVYEQFHALNNDYSFRRYFIDEETFEQLKDFEVKPGDVLISCSGVYLGKLSVVPKDALPGVINQALLKVTLNENEMNQQFFVSVFSDPSFKNKHIISNRGSGIPNLPPMTVMKKIGFITPPLSLQNQFAAIVTKIEEQKALVQMAIDESQYLFDSLMNEYFN